MARKTKEEAEKTRIQILETALRVFHDRGYSGATLVDIAKEIHLTKGAIYHHFKSKVDLFLALGKHMEEKLESRLETLFSHGDEIKGIQDLALGVVRLVAEDPELYRYYSLIYYRIEWQEELLPVKEWFYKQDAEFNSYLQDLFRKSGEFIEFLEYSIPEICHSLINLYGTLVIIALINKHLLLLCLAASVISAMIYWFTGNRLLALNRGQNDELERQVELIGTGTGTQIFNHFKQLMGWRIRLSDLETLNFTGIWLSLSAMLVLSVLLLAQTNTPVGQLLAAVMYVFQFIENVVAFPLYYQQMIRLQEITRRLQ